MAASVTQSATVATCRWLCFQHLAVTVSHRRRREFQTIVVPSVQSAQRKMYAAKVQCEMTYRIVPLAITLSDRHAPSFIDSLFNCYFTYSCHMEEYGKVIQASRGPSTTAEPLSTQWYYCIFNASILTKFSIGVRYRNVLELTGA